MDKILFLCGKDSVRGPMAYGFVRAAKISNVEVFSAGIRDSAVDPLAVKVMSEIGVDISDYKSRSLAVLEDHAFDVVIALCSKAAEDCPVLPGYPERVDWSVQDPSTLSGDDEKMLDEYRKTRDEIRALVKDLFQRGYMRALVDAKTRSSIILDNISDGIIAHDLDRRVFFFNKAAEEITGFSRSEVLEQDCHEVFPGKFCGGKCKFCDDFSTLPGDDSQELSIVTKSGEKRIVKMWLRMMSDNNGNAVGVLGAFRDITRERRLERRAGEIDHFAGIIGRDKQMLEIFDLIRDLADTSVPVMIQGESGTGKELVAAAIHNEGPRASGLFVPVNCGALPESLLESELFGHVKGAFTGAIRDKKGRFELADGGTIFLDEIGDITPAMQVRLLRVIQEGTFERVGSEKTIKVNVRIISATNKDINEEIAEGRFREDLYYRLSVVPVFLPPLSERRNDIPLLVEHILNRELEHSGKTGISMSHDTIEVMMSYEWPGNIRELQNWIQFALVKCKSGEIMPTHLPPKRGVRSNTGMETVVKKRRRRKLDLLTVRAAIRDAGGNKLEAAKALGVSRATLYRFLDEYNEV